MAIAAHWNLRHPAAGFSELSGGAACRLLVNNDYISAALMITIDEIEVVDLAAVLVNTHGRLRASSFIFSTACLVSGRSNPASALNWSRAFESGLLSHHEVVAVRERRKLKVSLRSLSALQVRSKRQLLARHLLVASTLTLCLLLRQGWARDRLLNRMMSDEITSTDLLIPLEVRSRRRRLTVTVSDSMR